MADIIDLLKEVITAIQDQQGYPKVPVEQDSHLVRDLGFASLDIAQLIAMMEGETGADPFAQGASLEQVATVMDLANVYRQHV